MARAAPLQSSFNSGEFSPRLEGRVDIQKYGNACKLLENYVPLIQGPAQRRGGWRFVSPIKDSTKRSWLVSFEFNTTQAYQIEFGDLYVRFWANHGQVIVSGVAAYNGGTAYVIGDLVVQGGVNYYCIAATTGNSPPNITYWYPLTGVVYEIPTPYPASALTDANGMLNLRFIESADVLYICLPGYQPRKLSRTGATTWKLTAVQPIGGPFKTENITATTVYASAATGAVTLTASAAIFNALHVGSLFLLNQKSIIDVKQWEAGKALVTGDLRRSGGINYKALNTATTGTQKPTHTTGAAYDGDTGVQWAYQDPGYGIVLLTGYTSPTVMTGTVQVIDSSQASGQLPDNAVLVGKATTRWAFAAWSDLEGWPTQVNFFRQRLCFARDTAVWMSVSSDYENFSARDLNGLVTNDMSLSVTLNSPKVNTVQWIEPINNNNVEAFVCGTAGAEHAIKSQTENQPFGPDNLSSLVISQVGSRNLRPVKVGTVPLFIQRAGTKLRDVSYDFAGNTFDSLDQSILSEHMLRTFTATTMAYQQEPYSLIWVARNDGALVCMTYSREQYPEAPHGGWHRQTVGGAGFVESLSVTPAPDGTRDEVWAIIRYTINGTTARYVCYLEKERSPGDDPEDQFYVDCGLSLNNAVAATLTPGAGATVAHTPNVLFTAGSAVFGGGDINRKIVYRYKTTGTDVSGNPTTVFVSAKATITQYVDTANVICTVDAAFPSLSTIASGGWKLSVTTISGLSHLEGQTVQVLADGATHVDRVVSSGSITLQNPSTKVHVGFGSPANLQTMRLNIGAQDGTAQGKLARIDRIAVRVLETLGLQYGSDFANLLDADFRTALDSMDTPPALFTGDLVLDFPDDYDRNPWLCLRQPYPLASTIIAVMPQVTVQDRG